MSKMDPDAEWLELGQLGNTMLQMDKNFSCSKYGYSKLAELFEAVPFFEKRLTGSRVEIRKRRFKLTPSRKHSFLLITQVMDRTGCAFDWLPLNVIYTDILS